jgi:hypothetical protein
VHTDLVKRDDYQSTNSVVRAEPVATGVWTAVLDLLERLVKITKKLLTLLHVRVAVRVAIGLVLLRFRGVRLEAEDARNAAHDGLGWSVDAWNKK